MTIDIGGHPFIPYRPQRIEPRSMLDRGREFANRMAQRRSVRMFSDEPVPRHLIELAVQTAATAPSGAHRQPWTFVVTGDPAVKREIRLSAEAEERVNYEGGRMNEEWLRAVAPLQTDWHKPFLETAPWLVVVFEQRHGIDGEGNRIHNYYVKESVGIACGLFIAALHTMGLSTLTHTPSPMAFLNRILGRPRNERPFVLFPVGYAAPDAVVPDLVRKPLDQVMVEVGTPAGTSG